MRQLVKRIAYPFLSFWYKQSAKRTRIYREFGLTLHILPSVFHPGLFLSTHVFIYFLDQVQLQGRRVLELGAGSGLIAFVAAQKGAITTATDINPQAIKGLEENAKRNQINLNVISSDLFEKVSPMNFDLIFINPPYYAKNPENDLEKAFYCGEDFNYFKRLFEQLNTCPTDQFPDCYMILSEDCDFERISIIARNYRFSLTERFKKSKLAELSTIYLLEHI